MGSVKVPWRSRLLCLASGSKPEYFSASSRISWFGDLLSRGTLGPGVAKAISSAELVRLSVQVHGAQGNPRSITVMLVDSTASASPLPSQPAVVTRNLPGADAGSPGTHVWGFRQATLQGRQVASLDLQQNGALLAAIRCMMTPDAEPLPGVDPRAGPATDVGLEAAKALP